MLLSPVLPKATEKLWESLGAAASLGALSAQPLRDAGRFEQLPAGSTVTPLQPLFPRIEPTVA